MKIITHDLNHDLIFYCTVFRVLGIYNFGRIENKTNWIGSDLFFFAFGLASAMHKKIEAKNF